MMEPESLVMASKEAWLGPGFLFVSQGVDRVSERHELLTHRPVPDKGPEGLPIRLVVQGRGVDCQHRYVGVWMVFDPGDRHWARSAWHDQTRLVMVICHTVSCGQESVTLSKRKAGPKTYDFGI